MNCCLIPFKIVPEPIEDDAFCSGEVAKILTEYGFETPNQEAISAVGG